MRVRGYIRAAVCAVLIALAFVGAEFGPAQAAAGQRTKPATLLDGAARQHSKQGGYANGAAAFPLMVDSTFSLQHKLQVGDGEAQDLFGRAIAVDGDTMVVGAPNDTVGGRICQGSVYVFTRNGLVWTLQEKITAINGEANEYFGRSVAISGDTIAVGVPFDNVGDHELRGSVYVFKRNFGHWSMQQILISTFGGAEDTFGSSVALEGDTLLVGAPHDDDLEKTGNHTTQGSAFVFMRSEGVWTQQQKLTASNGAAGDEFGSAVTLSGNRLAVGAPRDDDDYYLPDSGSVYLFSRYGGVWSEQQQLTALYKGPGDQFGSAVALDGETLVVGAPYDNIADRRDQGSAYVFGPGGEHWTQLHHFTADDGEANDQFGTSVAISGDTVVVGAPWDKVVALELEGSAYVFKRVSYTYWEAQQKLSAYDLMPEDNFGESVAVGGETLVVGAPYDNIGANMNQGSAYIYYVPSCATITFSPDTLPNGSTGMAYQQALTVSGGTAPYQLSVSNGTLPPGLTLTQGGLLSGTPTTPGTYQFTVYASPAPLSGDCSASHAYSITVTAGCSRLTLEPAVLPDGMLGREYSQTLTASGGSEPYRFVAEGTLPPGLSLSPQGVLSGTPTTEGSFSFGVRVMDAQGCSATWQRSVTVRRGRE